MAQLSTAATSSSSSQHRRRRSANPEIDGYSIGPFDAPGMTHAAAQRADDDALTNATQSLAHVFAQSQSQSNDQQQPQGSAAASEDTRSGDRLQGADDADALSLTASESLSARATSTTPTLYQHTHTYSILPPSSSSSSNTTPPPPVSTVYSPPLKASPLFSLNHPPYPPTRSRSESGDSSTTATTESSLAAASTSHTPRLYNLNTNLNMIAASRPSGSGSRRAPVSASPSASPSTSAIPHASTSASATTTPTKTHAPLTTRTRTPTKSNAHPNAKTQTPTTTTSTAVPPPAGMGSPSAPVLQRRTSEIASFSSFSSLSSSLSLSSSHSLDGEEGEGEADTPSSSWGSSIYDHSESLGVHSQREKGTGATTSKSALELLTKGRITSNLAVYKPRELWKPDAHAEKCDTPDCHVSFLLPFASTLGSLSASIPFPSLPSMPMPFPSFSSSLSLSSSLSSPLNSVCNSLNSLSLVAPATLTQSRHHCRMCGGVFCSNCASAEAALLDTRCMPWVFPPEGHEVLGIPVPVPGTRIGAGPGLGEVVGEVVGDAREGVRDLVRRSRSVGEIIRRRISISSSASIPEDAAEEEVTSRSFEPSSSSPIKRRKSSLAAIVASYTSSSACSSSPSTSTSSSSSPPTSSSLQSTSTSPPTPSSSYRTPAHPPASPSNPHPPTFSLPLHGAATSLAASALPSSSPLVRVERVCVGCAALLRGAAGKGRSVVKDVERERELRRKGSVASMSSLGESLLAESEEGKRAREDVMSFRDRLNSNELEATSPVSPSPTGSGTPHRRRRSVRKSTTPSDVVEAAAALSAGGGIQRNDSISSIRTTSSSSLHNPQGQGHHAYSPVISSPLSPRSPRGSRFSMPQPGPGSDLAHAHTHALGHLPKRTLSNLIPAPSLPAILEPPSESAVAVGAQGSSSGNTKHSPSGCGVRAVRGTARPGMRRAHSSNEVPTGSTATVTGPKGSPLARASSLREAPISSTSIPEKSCTEKVNASAEHKPKGRHVAWLPSSSVSLSVKDGAESISTSPEVARPSALRTTAGPVPLLVVPAEEQVVASAAVQDLPSSGMTTPTPESATSITTTTTSESTKTTAQKKERTNPTFMLYGPAKFDRLSLREVLQQTLGAEDSEEEGDTTVTQSRGHGSDVSSPSEYDGTGTSHSASHSGSSADGQQQSGLELGQPHLGLGPAFPASPPPMRDFGLYAPPFGDGTRAHAPIGLLSATTSRITTPAAPPSLRDRDPDAEYAYQQEQYQRKLAQRQRQQQQQQQRQQQMPTPPITRPPSATDLAKLAANKARREAYTAHERYETELAARRNSGRIGNTDPFGLPPYYANSGAGATGAATGVEKPLLVLPGEDVRVPVAPTQHRRDLVKPLYAMTFSTF